MPCAFCAIILRHVARILFQLALHIIELWEFFLVRVKRPRYVDKLLCFYKQLGYVW